MAIEKSGVEDALKLNIEEINIDRICKDYSLHDEKNCVDLLEDISSHFTPLSEEYFYSDDSTWVEFFKSRVVEWFGQYYGLVVIDTEYWLLSFALLTDNGVKLWDFSQIDTEDLESARKLVKLLSVVEAIGAFNKFDLSMNWQD
jgi:hypothetical protein